MQFEQRTRSLLRSVYLLRVTHCGSVLNNVCSLQHLSPQLGNPKTKLGFSGEGDKLDARGGVVMENCQHREVPFYLTTLSSQPQQSLSGYCMPVLKSPGLLVQHQRPPTNCHPPALYPSHELPGISLRQPARWVDASSTRPG